MVWLKSIVRSPLYDNVFLPTKQKTFVSVKRQRCKPLRYHSRCRIKCGHSLACNGAGRNCLLKVRQFCSEVIFSYALVRLAPNGGSLCRSGHGTRPLLRNSDIKTNCTDAPARVCAVSYPFFLEMSRKSSEI